MTDASPSAKRDDLEYPITFAWLLITRLAGLGNYSVHSSMAETLHPSDWDTALKFHIEIGNVKDDERLLVLVTHGFIELLMNTLIEEKCKHGKQISSDSRGYTHSIKLVILHELGLIEDDLYQILDWFRRLRNKAAHEPFFEITLAEWDIIKKFLDKRSPDRRGRSELHQFCLVLEGAVWNSHSIIFAPIFADKTIERLKKTEAAKIKDAS